MDTPWAQLFNSNSTYTTVDSVLDFVGGTSDTALDVGDYDAMMGVDLESSCRLFAGLKQSSNGAIGDRLGTILEIGAGTGFLTLGMLNDVEAYDFAAITDISPRMLAVCRERVSRHIPRAISKTVFATYAGGHAGGRDVFANDAFDLVIANSVLHHIPDYRAFLADMRMVLRPGGIAYFSEPGAPYHDALSRAMEDTVIDMIAAGLPLDADMRMIAAFLENVRFRLCFPEDPRLMTMEDKHIFARAALERAAGDADFRNVSITPALIDENGVGGVNAYLLAFKVAPSFADRFMATYLKYAPVYFNEVDPADRAMMYTCIFYR